MNSTTSGQYPQPPVTDVVETGDGYLLHGDGFDRLITHQQFHAYDSLTFGPDEKVFPAINYGMSTDDYETIRAWEDAKTVAEVWNETVEAVRARWDTESDAREAWIPELDGWRANPAEFGTPGEPKPAVYRRDDGHTLLYAGLLNWLSGLPGTCKSWLALDACGQVMRAGGRAAYIDYEADQATMGDRAATLGLRPLIEDGDRFAYVEGWRYEEPGRRRQLLDWLTGGDNLLVFDSLLEAGCPSESQAIPGWIDGNLKPLTGHRFATLAVDHVPLRKEPNRASAPIGSVRKLATVSGVALKVTGDGWTRDTDGAVTLTVDKDRHGQVGPKNKSVAVIRGSWHNGGFSLRLDKPRGRPTTDEDELTSRVVEYLAGHPEGQSLRQIRKNVTGNGQAIGIACENLVNGGHAVKLPGERKGWFTYRLSPAGREAHGLLPDNPALTLV